MSGVYDDEEEEQDDDDGDLGHGAHDDELRH